MRRRIFWILMMVSCVMGVRAGFCIDGDEFDREKASQAGQPELPDNSFSAFEAEMHKNIADPLTEERDTAIARGGSDSGSNASASDVLAPSGDSRGDKEYILEASDKVNVKIFPEDQYIRGGDMQVSGDGNITLALVGKIPVAGKSVAEAEREIAKILDADYLVDPEVVIEVLQFKEQSVIILGQVKRPGTYSFPPNTSRLTLLQAISLAGGFSDVANIKKIKLVRKAGGENKVSRVNAEAIISGDEPDVEVESGDVVHVSESLF